MEEMNKEKKERENHYLLPCRISMFTGKTREHLFEESLRRGEEMIPVTDIIEVKLSKLGHGIEDEFMQIFARLKDYVAADLETTNKVSPGKPSDDEITEAINQR